MFWFFPNNILILKMAVALHIPLSHLVWNGSRRFQLESEFHKGFHGVFPMAFAFSGYATFSEDQQSILVSNLVTGIDSYAVSGVSPGVPPVLQQSFRHSISHNVPLQITSALYGSWVISGSDDGSVRIFDQRSGELLKSLRHADGTLPDICWSYFWLHLP